MSPTESITFEVEWEMGDGTLEVAHHKEMEACLKSIKYARDVLGMGK